MATIDEVYQLALQNRTAINSIKDKAKQTGDFSDAGVLQDTDEVRVVRGGASLKSTVGAIKAASGGGDLNVQSDWLQSDIGADDFIKNKPTNLSDFNNDLPPNTVTADAYSSLQTGIITGGEVTINGGNAALVDIAAGTGIVMDWTDPSNPVRYEVSWNAFTGVAMQDISQPFTNFYIDKAGALIKVSGVLSSPEVRRGRIQLQTAEHANGITVTNITGGSRPAYQVSDALLDYVLFLGPLNKGNLYADNGSGLTVQKLSGQTAIPFVNRANNKLSPTIKDDPAVPTVSFTYIYRNGVGGFAFGAPTTIVNPDNYDDGSGTLASAPTNKFTIQRFYLIPATLQTFVTYGQAIYDSLEEAKAAIFVEDPELPGLISQAVFTTALIVKDGTTDLSNTANAEFVDIEFFGRTGSGGGSGGSGDMLKSVYDTDNDGIVDNAEALNGFADTDFVKKTEFKYDTERRVHKKPGNVALTSLEVGDIVSGWWNSTLYLKQAVYNGGDDTLIASYTVIDSIEF